MKNSQQSLAKTDKTDSSSRRTTNEIHELDGSLRILLADMFALFIKTKNFHWHMSGPHFRDYHLMLDEQADQILAATDPIAERARKLGAKSLHSIGEIARIQRIIDNDVDFVPATDMLMELESDNYQLSVRLIETRTLCEELGDFATASLIENWIDEAEGRTWFLHTSTSPGS